MAEKEEKQPIFIPRYLYFVGLIAKTLLVCGVWTQAVFMSYLSSLHVSFPFILSIINIVSVVVVISVNHMITKQIIEAGSRDDSRSSSQKALGRSAP